MLRFRSYEYHGGGQAGKQLKASTSNVIVCHRRINEHSICNDRAIKLSNFTFKIFSTEIRKEISPLNTTLKCLRCG